MKNLMTVVLSALCAAVSFTSEARQIRVACIGDSITVSSTNASVPGMYPNTLQELLGDGYLVGNFGEGGTTGWFGNPWWREGSFTRLVDVLKFRPDVIIWMFGVNDANKMMAEEGNYFQYPWLEGWADDIIMGKIVNNLKNKPRVVIGRPSYVYGSVAGQLWQTDWKTGETRNTNWIQPYMEDFQARVAANLGTAVPLVDIYTLTYENRDAWLTKAVGSDVDRLTKMAEEFGLASLPPPLPDWREKGLITILRRNWHLLAYPQLCTLLGLTPMELAARLAGDDFVRLGQVKPQCEPLVYTDGEAEAGLAERKRFVAVMERTKCDPAALSEPRFQFDPDLRIDFPYVPALDGAEQTPKVQAAREALSEGLREYASLGAGASCGPQRMGPANPLYAKPTGWSAAAGGLPYDDLKRWASPSSPAVWIDRMRKVEQCFVRGCKLLAQAVAEMDDEDVRTAAKRELDFLKAEALHIHSAANQAEFVIARDRGQKDLANWLADDEVTTARRLFPLVSADSRIGYESANGYFYLPRDLIEKIVSCLRAKARQ